jgi:hypothetical protein
MIKLIKPVLLGLSTVLVLATPAATVQAHHSAAMFDRAKTITLRGTLKSYEFVAPHAWISLNTVPDKSRPKAERWDVECTSAMAMRRLGVTPENLKPGDVITVKINPLKDGRKGGSLVEITLADGSVRANTYADIPYGQLR